ncbi:RNA polymerase sigma factor [Stieleria bergensis]|uniref:RNA polymerase sigma factor n=1 Tax=Stieleria bergensis TaxID=2528025 RepID=A0A517SVH0_9BACT|nr:RNA polymerase sigma factor [Planctomycetes bacterium SV_7m_r]
MEDAAHDAIETIASSAPDSWIARLQGNQVTRDEAIEELRRILLRGLSKSFGAGNSVGMHLEDVVQEALLKVLESLQQFQGRSRFTTWAMTIATRIAISKRRRKHFADVSLDSLSRDRGTTFDVTSVEQSPAEVVDQQGMIAVLQQLIDEVLTDRQRVAIRALLDGLPVEVIAAKTDSNRNSVYKLIHDAKLKLRSGLEAAGVASDDLNFGTH